MNNRREIIPNSESGFVAADPTTGLPSWRCGWMQRTFRFEEISLILTVPGQPDELLEEPSVLAASRDDDEMPYWAYLWPAAIEMIRFVIAAPWPSGTKILELGCGAGLVSLGALARGHHVTLTDFDPHAIAVASHNARQNGYVNFCAAQLDWRQPPEGQYSVILGCDLLYEERNLRPVLGLLDQMLAPGGECWLADGGRRHAQAFWQLAQDHGYHVCLVDAEGQEQSTVGDHFQMFQLKKARLAVK